MHTFIDMRILYKDKRGIYNEEKQQRYLSLRGFGN